MSLTNYIASLILSQFPTGLARTKPLERVLLSNASTIGLGRDKKSGFT
jgi:hypothetical protein